MNTATSDIDIERMVKPISPAPTIAAAIGALPSSICRAMFSIITMASSTTKPTAIVSAISERLSRLKPSTYITAKVPTSDNGTAIAGITVAQSLRRKRKMTPTTSAIVSINVNCMSATLARMV